MSALTCPFKPVKQHAQIERPHEHRFELEILLDDGTYVQDCACGFRRRVRKGYAGECQDLQDGLVEGGTSLENSIFLRTENGAFHDRWSVRL